jgi:5-methylcytosine-specific restriction enzyme subunit McrC
MKNLTLREAYDWIYVDEQSPNGVTQAEWENLLHFLEEKYRGQHIMELGIRKLRFINLVGIIQLKTVRIEILPKISLHHHEESLNRRALLNMLNVTKQLPVQLHARTLSQFEKVDLSHLLAHLFVTELYKALKRGIYRGYEQKQENLTHLKGRLMISPHLRKNANHSIHAFCEYDELSPNVSLNQVLKAALKVIHPIIKQNTIRTQSMKIHELFNEVDERHIDKNLLENIPINRQNQHYEDVLQLAIAILQSTSMTTSFNQQTAFFFLFKMNDLFEGYVGECLKMVTAPTGYQLDHQHKEKRLLINVYSGRSNISLKPDFVISKNEAEGQVPILVMDTKWKSIFNGVQMTYNQADLYQMYAYITAYKSAERCILLYPKVHEEFTPPKWQIPDVMPKKYIEIGMVRLDRVDNTVVDLDVILENTLINC